MPISVEGFAIVSEDGMLADASGAMPSALVVEADQKFLSDSLDRVDLIVHARNSYENQAKSQQRRRLIATHGIETIAPAESCTHALFWNPAGLPLEKAAEMLGVRNGTVAILGGAFFCAGMTCFISRGWRGCDCPEGARFFHKCQNGNRRMSLPRPGSYQGRNCCWIWRVEPALLAGNRGHDERKNGPVHLSERIVYSYHRTLIFRGVQRHLPSPYGASAWRAY
jgi:hypothetical protein